MNDQLLLRAVLALESIAASLRSENEHGDLPLYDLIANIATSLDELNQKGLDVYEQND